MFHTLAFIHDGWFPCVFCSLVSWTDFYWCFIRGNPLRLGLTVCPPRTVLYLLSLGIHGYYQPTANIYVTFSARDCANLKSMGGIVQWLWIPRRDFYATSSLGQCLFICLWPACLGGRSIFLFALSLSPGFMQEAQPCALVSFGLNARCPRAHQCCPRGHATVMPLLCICCSG